ncbi:MAG: 7-carboxy-7-deazaguanine synthase QueE [Methanosarcinales archaeon]|nr:7-carboxy-7-deazaguanine synthase QueE [Methanosarcinales archaeon]
MIKPAYIGEIFNSIQGEGIFAGIRQVFIRFQGCPLNCGYCDTPRSRERIAHFCKIESIPGSGEFKDIPNPIELATLVETINDVWSPGTRHLVLTGGEPLMHADFIDALSREVDYPLYLETNGCLPDRARDVQYVIDVAACDIKLPEHNAYDDYRSLLKAELETLGVFYEAGAATFSKTVVTDKTNDDDLKTIANSLSEIDAAIPLILQPVTSCPGFEPPSTQRLLELLDVVGDYLIDVRAIPQVHKIMGQL